MLGGQVGQGEGVTLVPSWQSFVYGQREPRLAGENSGWTWAGRLHPRAHAGQLLR
jgi:hypothetical protein